jgi:peptidoglycan/LPS O-acetylase OafA/YrhL
VTQKLKMPYDPVIDGLRALAIISVIFYHSKIIILDVDLFKGGFVGVDIFFCNIWIFNYINYFK